MEKTSVAILGFGARGRTVAYCVSQPEFFGQVVAVAEPDPDVRKIAQRDYNLTDNQVFETAEELLSQPKLADVVANTTLDHLHARTSIPAMEKGYHLFLEKPMAVTEEDCRAIEAAQRRTGRVVAVCHSMRYHRAYAATKEMLDSGLIGDIVSFTALEGVENIHFSHSYCRGNWRNEETSSFMLMTKSCHDIDLFHYLTGRKCTSVSSFGRLSYFTPENRPAGAPERCLDGCPAESECPYHVAKVYLQHTGWRYVFPRQDDASTIEYLKTGPYGRCVFQCDNNVVDHQVVAMEFEGGITGNFTMTAFHPGGRLLRVHGTKGYLEVDVEQNTITHVNLITRNSSITKVKEVAGGHGGADYFVLKSFMEAVRKEDPSAVLTTAQESLSSHLTVFAAEQARKEGRVVTINS